MNVDPVLGLIALLLVVYGINGLAVTKPAPHYRGCHRRPLPKLRIEIKK